MEMDFPTLSSEHTRVGSSLIWSLPFSNIHGMPSKGRDEAAVGPKQKPHNTILALSIGSYSRVSSESFLVRRHVHVVATPLYWQPLSMAQLFHFSLRTMVLTRLFSLLPLLSPPHLHRILLMASPSPPASQTLTRTRFEANVFPQHAHSSTAGATALSSALQSGPFSVGPTHGPVLSTLASFSHVHVSRSSAREISSSHVDSRNGPNTRSRKRRTTEQISTAQPAAPAQRKRARTKPASLKKPPPETQAADDDKKPAALDSCCICMCDVEPEDLAGINGCEHKFCFGCIEKWGERENSCPLCKNRFNKIDRVHKKRKKGHKNSKKVKQRDQRSDLVPGAALEGLLGRLIEQSRHRVTGRPNDLTDFFSSANFASRHPNPPSIARLIFSGVGNFNLESIHGPTRYSRAPRSNTRSVTFNDRLDLSSDEEESPLSNFIRAFHGHVSGHSVMQVVRPMTVTTHIASRSYASNSNDGMAGSRAENPLEIDDDSDDDTVEVVQVRRPA
jgi:hypothetical protein